MPCPEDAAPALSRSARIPSFHRCVWGLAGSLVVLCGTANAADDPRTATHGLGADLPSVWLQTDSNNAQATDEATLAHWWQQFGDPQLQTLIHEALERNLDLRSARATLAQARASRAVIEAGGRPQLSTPVSAARSRADHSSSKLYKLGVNASWELDWNHSIDAGVRAADADLRSAMQDLATTRMVITAEVALAYFEWRGAQWRLRIAQASLQSQEETQTLIDWKAQAGLLSRLDQDEARQSTEQVRASLPALNTEVFQYEHQLATLTGRTPVQLHGSLSADSNWPATDPLIARLGAGVPADLLRRRPDLRSAEAKVLAQWYRMVQARRDGEPTLALTGSLGFQALTLSALTNGGATIAAALGLNFDWPIWEGGKRETLVAEQKAAWELTRSHYESTLLGAVQDVEDSLVATRDSLPRCQALQNATDAAQRVVDTNRLRHEAGLTDTVTLLDSQRALLALQNSLAGARTDQTLALVRLYKALGGGWSDDAAAAAAAPTEQPLADNPLSPLLRTSR